MFLPLLCSLIAAHRDVNPIVVDGVLCHPRQLLVRLEGSTTKLEAAGMRIVRTIPEIGYAIVETPIDQLQASRRMLAKVPGVESVELDHAAKASYTPNDTYWPNMWHPRAINVDKAWDTSLGSNLPIVAILDTGVQVDHPDLAANMWVNSGEIPGNGIDDDHNGYIDDVNGYDFAYGDASPNDVYGHGTACAGLAAAVGDNNTGVIGTAPHARIMALKVANDSGYFYASATVPAYVYGAKMGARVYSMSYYADGVQPAEETALKWAYNRNVLPIAAAGNDSTVYTYYPGAYDFVLSVAALNTDLSKAGFSDYGSWVHVAAPGVSLYTTTTGSGYTSGFAGTSGATPIVSGLAALLIGANPAATNVQVKAAIEDSATALNDSHLGEYTIYGLVNAQAAMAAITGTTAARRSPRLNWISPIGASATAVRARAYGRSLDGANVLVNGVIVPRKAVGREWVDFDLPATSGAFKVKVMGQVLGPINPPTYSGYYYPMIEACSQQNWLAGGYLETLRNDSKYLNVVADASGYVRFQATFKNLPKTGKFNLVIRRRYVGATNSGTEALELYDWKSWSYPYASYVTLKQTATSNATINLTVPINDISQFVDPDGTAYFVLEASGAAANQSLLIDSLYLQPAS